MNIIAATQNVTFDLTKSVDNAMPELNQLFTYTIFYRCASLTDTHCNDMVITDQLSDDLKFVSATEGAHPATITESGNLVTFTFDQPVLAGSTGQLAITVRIPLSAGVNSGDVILNTATIDASNASAPLDSNPVNVTATVGSEPATYEKDSRRAIAAVDTDFTYQLVIYPASSVVTNATIVDDLPTGTIYISCSGGDSCNYDSTNHRVTWTDASLTDWNAYRVIVQFPSNTFSNGDVVVNSADFDFTDGNTPVSVSASENTTIAPVIPVIDVHKWGYAGDDVWGNQDVYVQVGQEAAYPYRINNAGTADLTNVVVTDILPTEFDFTRTQTPRFNSPYPTGLVLYYELNGSGNWTQFPASAYSNGTGADPSTGEMITLADLGISVPDEVTGIRIEIATMDIGIGTSNGSHGIIYGTINTNAIGSSTVENCLSGTADGGASDSKCVSVNIFAHEIAALDSYKWVKGLDELGFVNPINSDICEDNGQGYTRYPCVAQTVQGGLADYQLILENPSTVTMTDIILVDVLPSIGDVGVLVTDTRDTEWTPNLAGVVTAPAGVTVYYSTSSNPCRGEVGGPTAGCDAPNWSTTLPTDITTVGALKFDFDTIEISPGEQLLLAWPMRVPNGTPTDEIAWNSFAYVASRADNGVELLSSEPPKVGIITTADIPNIYGDYIWLDTDRDGIQDGSETGINGVQIDLYEDVNGTPNDFTDDRHVSFTISGNDNSGNPGYYLFPNLPDGDYYAVATPPAVYAISPVDASGDGGANDTTDAEDDSDFDPTTMRTPITTLGPRDTALDGEIDKSWDLGLYLLGPSILLEKTVYTGHDSGASCPGVELVQASTGADVTYCFVITNNGETDLDDITFADATLGITGADVVPPIITSTVLAQGNSMTLYYEAASLGTITNTATVDGRPVDGSGDPLTDPDSGNLIDRPTDDDTAATEEGSAMVMIGDRVWIEDDNDGDATTGNVTPVVGATVTATASDGTTYTNVTDASGNYNISAPADAVYTVTISTPTGTTPAGTLITADSDPTTQNDLSHNGSDTVITVGAEDNLTIDFGFYEPPPSPPPPVCGTDPGDLGGTIWRDYNSNGIQDANESGFDDVTVTAYDNDGNGVTVPVNPDGTYVFSDIYATETHIRLEFSGLPDWTESGVHGADSGTTVQIHTVANCDADLAVQNPADYCQNNPHMGVACYESGTGDGNMNAGFVSFPYDSDGLPVGYADNSGSAARPRKDAIIDDLAAIWGAAYQSEEARLFTASFLKRHVAFNDGPGYVYILDYSNEPTVTVAYTFDLDNVTPATGPVIDLGFLCRQSATDGDPNASCDPLSTGFASDYTLYADPVSPSIDLDAFAKVGTISYGDIDLGEDGDTLWLVNLNQRSLIDVDVSNGTTTGLPGTVNHTLLGGLTVTRLDTTSTTFDGLCDAADGVMRPWGLEFKDGVGYVGAICDASLSQDTNDLVAYVFSFDPANLAGGLQEELNFALDYTRENGQGSQFNPGLWRPWASTWAEADPYTVDIDNNYMAPQPILSDIEITEDGSMTMALMDRFGHQNGRFNYTAISQSSELADTNSIGDIVHACNVNGVLIMEEGNSGSSCPTTDNNHMTGVPSNTLLQNDGPSNAGEYYFEDYFNELDNFGNNNYTHAETTTGSLALLIGSQEVASTVIDPLWGAGMTNSQGIVLYDTTTGARAEIAPGDDHGYMVVDRSDVNAQTFAKANGLGDLEMLCLPAPLEIGNYVWLDEDEDGIQDPCEPALAGVAVVLTAADGSTQMTITDANGEYYFPVDANSAYTLTIDMTQPELITATLTTPNVDAGTTITDGIDSDAIANGNLAVINLTTGNAGENDHTFDFGFVTGPLQVLIGDRVWIEDDNDGLATTGVITPVVGSVVTAVGSDGTVYTDITDALGYYTITVPANDIYTVTVATPAGTVVAVPTGGLVATDSDPTTDNDTSHEPAGTVVTVGTEGNLTIDFGFYEVPPDIPSLAISKMLNTSEPVNVGQLVSFTIRITNTGNVAITTLPLTDSYDITYLAYDSTIGSTPATDDNANDGQLAWSDLTATEGDLAPGEVIEVMAHFTAIADTEALASQSPCTNAGESCNVAAINNAMAGPDLLPPVADSDDVAIEEQITDKSTLGDFVWYDTNGDGIKEPGELGINGVIINLYDSTGLITTTVTMSDTDGIGDDTGTTNGDGFYDFQVASSTAYTVEIDPANFDPGGALEGYDYTGNHANMPYNGDETRVVIMPADQHDENNVDFGYVAPLFELSFELSKVLNTPPPVRINDVVSFTILITNTGTTAITAVPLTDTYNNAYFTYITASPLPDNPTQGVLTWNNLTEVGASGFGMDLNPGATFEVVVEFSANLDTTGLPNDSAINMADSQGISDMAEVPIFTPTSVQLAAREATYKNGNVILQWETADETDLVGFYIYRQLAGNDGEKRVQLTEELLVAKKSGSSSGEVYTYEDETAQANVNYRYFVSILNSNGQENQELLGDVLMQRTVNEWFIFLPIALK